jgi:chemotaxis protein methyltransferase CheR
MNLTIREFEEIRNHIYRVSGLFIHERFMAQADKRLQPLLRVSGANTFKGLITRLIYKNDVGLCDQVILAITSEEDYFFSDVQPFDTFTEVILPDLSEIIIDRKRKSHVRRGAKINIWSASASKGHEPYGIAMLIDEFVEKNGYTGVDKDDFFILASEISGAALAKAVAGEYSAEEMSVGLSSQRREKYFQSSGDGWALRNIIQDMVDFRKVSLAEPFTRLGGFDVIFCRNVLEHLNEATRRSALTQFTYMLTRNGYLVLDRENNLNGFLEYYQRVEHNGSMVFRRRQNMEFSAV